MTKLPVVTAPNMLTAQGYRPTAAELATIKARADFFELEGMSRQVQIRVEDTYTGAPIGYLIFNS